MGRPAQGQSGRDPFASGASPGDGRHKPDLPVPWSGRDLHLGPRPEPFSMGATGRGRSGRPRSFQDREQRAAPRKPSPTKIPPVIS